MQSLQSSLVTATGIVVTLGYLFVLCLLVRWLIRHPDRGSVVRALIGIAALVGTLPPILNALAGLNG